MRAFSFAGPVVLLGGMLLPGYVLTLDLVFGPNVIFPSAEKLMASGYPVTIIRYFLSHVMEMWIVEKIILFGLFFLLFYLPARFYLFAVPGEKASYAAYFVSILYAVNPFVYERFLAGQWLVLAGYALLPAFLYALVAFYRDRTWRRVLMIAVSLLAIGLFSQHILVMGALVWGVFMLGVPLVHLLAGEREKIKTFVLRSAGALAVFVLVSSYWLIPYFLNPSNAPIAIFGPAHWDAFRTAGDEHLGVVGNVLSMYGFWGEREPWNNLFAMPKENTALWLVTLAPILALVVVGAVVGLRRAATRAAAVMLILTAAAATIFSAGIGDGTIWKPLNLWLFEHVDFWRGFRDSQKWSAFLVLAYAMLGGLGVSYLLEKIKTERTKKFACIALCVLPILYTPSILFGFNGQIKTVWYPDEWHEVNELFKEDEACKALFLPWHQYYYLRWNHGMLTGNVADTYFDCTMVSGKNMELGQVASQGGNGPEYDLLEPLVVHNGLDPDQVVAVMKERGIRYILFTKDFIGEDPYKYPFLRAEGLERVIHNKMLDLYLVL